MARFWAVPVFCTKSGPSEVLTQRPIFQNSLSMISQAWPAGLQEYGMSATVRVRISRIMPQNVYTRPPFYSWEKFGMYTRQPTPSG